MKQSEHNFKCFKCRDYKKRAYFNLEKKVGKCHNCDKIISKVEYERAFNKNLGDSIEIDDDYMTEEEFQKLHKKIPKFLTRSLTEKAILYIRRRFHDNVVDKMRELKLSWPVWKEFISIIYNERILFPCYDGKSFENYWLARSYDSNTAYKVLFPSNDMFGVKKTEVIYINEIYVANREKLDGLGLKIIPVICEGEFDALSVFNIVNDKLYVGIGILGKLMSTIQLGLIKDTFKSWNRDSSIVLCLDGDTKSAKDKSLAENKLKTIHRLNDHYDSLVVWDLGDDDPNSLLMKCGNLDWIKSFTEK